MPRILWMGPAPWCARSGYAHIARQLLPRLKKRGLQVTYFATYGLQGGILQDADGVEILPIMFSRTGSDILEAHYERCQADALLSCIDIWTIPAKVGEFLNWLAWMPVDHDPVQPQAIESARAARRVVSYSRWGMEKLQDQGINARHIPIGVDLDKFQPRDKQESRRELGWDEDAFWVATVALNVTAYTHKAFGAWIQAMAEFARAHEDVKYYVHTYRKDTFGGFDLVRAARSAGLDQIYFPDEYDYLMGQYDDYGMARIYSAADVYLGASNAEGFGMPILEAQACGTPVITTDFSAMPELTHWGWSVPKAGLTFTRQGSWRAIPDQESIVERLCLAYRYRDHSFCRDPHEDPWLQQFRWDRIADLWMELLREEGVA